MKEGNPHFLKTPDIFSSPNKGDGDEGGNLIDLLKDLIGQSSDINKMTPDDQTKWLGGMMESHGLNEPNPIIRAINKIKEIFGKNEQSQ